MQTQILFTSPNPPIELPDATLPDLVLETARRRADEIALVDSTTGASLTYREFADRVERVAAGFVDRGLQKGDVVAIVSINDLDYPVAALAVMRAGGVVSGVNPTYTAGELGHQLTDAGATWVIAHALFHAAVAPVAAELGIDKLMVFGDVDGAESFSALADHDLPPVTIEVGTSDLAALPYSSGTTGRSKGVRLNHSHLVANLRQSRDMFTIGEDDTVLAFLPMFHIMGFAIVAMGALEAGAKVVTIPMFEPQLFCQSIQDHRVNKLIVVPPVVNFLAAHPLVDQYDVSSVELLGCGAAPLSADMEAAVSARLGCVVGQGYGMTEVAGSTTMPREIDGVFDIRPGSSGQLVPGMEALVIDPETGASLGPHETGELWVRGPNRFDGYLNNDAATAETIDGDGWLHTGDLCHFDDDGFLFVTDRLKELIKVKGFQVAPAELEGLLLTHPAVADAAVIGRPDDRSGEVPVAHVVPNGDLDVEALMAWVAEQVADYKQLAEVVIAEQIPKNPSGKILRRELRGTGA